MYNKKVISVLLSTIIASSTSLGITPSINVFADDKNYENNLENEKFLLDMGEYENDDGILSFPSAKGVIKEQANLFFNFDGESNVKISYIKNGNKMEGITYEPSLKSRVINIRIENQQELEEVLKSLEIKCDGNVNFSIKLTSIPKGTISSNGDGEKEAIDGNLGSHFRADGAGWWQLLFDKETELDKINLTFGRKNGAEIQALKDGNWIKIGEAEDYPIDLYSRETQTIKVDKEMYGGIKVIPKISDDNISRLCEISFDETEAESFSYTDSPNLSLGESVVNGSFITFPHAITNGFDRLSLKLEYSVPIKTEYEVNGNKINSDEKVIITNSYDRKTINEILKSLKLDTNNQKVKINVSLVDMELKKTFPDGTVTTGTYYGAGYPANVIDCDVNTYWNAPSESGNINFKFPSQTKVDTIKLKVSPSTTIKNQYTITGKKGGSSEVIGQTVEIVKGNEMNTIDIPITKKGDYDEINVSSSWIATGGLGSAWATIHEIILNSNLEEELASDSVTVDKIESILNLELGEKKVINNKIKFPDAKGTITGSGSKLVFELNNVENQDTSIKYQLNGEEIIKKDKTIKIEINSQKELDEILKSLEITFDELEGCSLKIFSVSSDADMENLSWQIPKNFVASGIGYGNNQPSNVFKGSVGWNAGTYNTSMYLKNINNVYLSAIRYNSKNALIVRGKNNGTWKDIGSFETDLDNNVVGSYLITYSVSDSDDNRIRFSRIVHVLEKGEDIPENSEDIGDWENARWPQLEVRDVYLSVGDDFNIKSGLLYAYDEVDGYLTNKVKSSGTVNTIKEGVYSVSYKVTNSDNRTSIRSAAVLVREGGWNNGDGQLPDPGPDWGDNDNDNEHNNNIPDKPEQPEQPDDNNNDDKLPGIDDNTNQGGQNDYYIDKDGNKVFPDGSIVTPDDIEIKPNEDGEKPEIDDNGNIIVPPGGIIIFPDGTIQIPEDGAILKPDGVIIYPKKDEEIKDKDNNYEDNNSKEESSNSISSLINDEKIEKEIDNNIEKNNPPTGDTGIGIFWGLGILSTICLIFNRRKK